MNNILNQVLITVFENGQVKITPFTRKHPICRDAKGHFTSPHPPALTCPSCGLVFVRTFKIVKD